MNSVRCALATSPEGVENGRASRENCEVQDQFAEDCLGIVFAHLLPAPFVRLAQAGQEERQSRQSPRALQ
jgi:hypothetical protein